MGLFEDVTGMDEDFFLNAPYSDELTKAMYGAALHFKLDYIDDLRKNMCKEPFRGAILSSAQADESRFAEEGYIASKLKRLFTYREYAIETENNELYQNATAAFAMFSVLVIDYILRKYPSYRKKLFKKQKDAIQYAALSDLGLA